MTAPRWLAYVLPFAVLLVLLAAAPVLPLPPRAEAAVLVALPALAILAVARPALDLRVTRPGATMLLGVAVFGLWIAPDLLLPGYRDSVLFQNGLTGRVESSLAASDRGDPVILGLRFARAALIVPIVEELFWRGWLPRWVDRMDAFEAVPLGHYTRLSFWGTAAAFALEHGPWWEVGLLAGIGYNWWMSRTRSLGDLVLCHAVTNACLSTYVLVTGRWEYW